MWVWYSKVLGSTYCLVLGQWYFWLKLCKIPSVTVQGVEAGWTAELVVYNKAKSDHPPLPTPPPGIRGSEADFCGLNILTKWRAWTRRALQVSLHVRSCWFYLVEIRILSTYGEYPCHCDRSTAYVGPQQCCKVWMATGGYWGRLLCSFLIVNINLSECPKRTN